MKHNNLLLIDPAYLKQMNKNILDIKSQYALPVYNYEEMDNTCIPNEDVQFVINDQLFLDTLLLGIRGESISYAKNKERNNRENHLI